ncbi:MAG: hypothetical protein AB7G87_14390 [Clostridia bacterium]
MGFLKTHFAIGSKKIEFKFTDKCLGLLQEAYGEALYGTHLGVIERFQLPDYLVKIKTTNTIGEVRESEWLMFSETKSIETADKRTVNCPLGIAFATTTTHDNRRNIIPCNPGQVFVYFPAEKETSNLHFHIHAPFSSTVARDSIHDSRDNEILKNALVELFVNSLPKIRDLNYLNVSFLQILPNSSSDLPSFYTEFKNQIREALILNPFLPCLDGTYECARCVIRGPARISKCFTDSDIQLLYRDSKIKKWMISPGFNETEIERLVKDLNIAEMNGKTILRDMYDQNLGNKQTRFEALLKTKSDKWLVDFYLLLEAEAKEYELKRVLSNVAIIRAIDSDNNISHVKPALAFIPPNGITAPPIKVPFVKAEIWKNLSTAQRESLEHFFHAVGVKEYSELSLIQHELENQKEHSAASEHYRFIARCINYLKRDPSQIHLFQNKQILASDSDDPSYVVLTNSRELVLDLPFKDTGLAALCPINNTKKVSYGYYNHQDIQPPDFVDFAMKIGVQTGLRVEETSYFSEYNEEDLHRGFESNKETLKKIKKDYTIPFLTDYLEKAPSIKTSFLIWEALLSAHAEASSAQYSPNKQTEINSAPSTVVCILKSYKWIPNKQGIFLRPEDVIIDELHPDFKPNYSNGLLREIRFGWRQEAKTTAYQEKVKIAKAIGFKDYEEAEEIISAIKALQNQGVDAIEVLQKTLSSYKNESSLHFPEKAVKNPERREAKLAEAIDSSSEKIFEKKERSVHVNKNTVDARAWLKSLYTNENEIMLCQICQNPMPFKKRDGQPYFEAVELFSKDIILKEFEATHLALCPVCSAKYQEYVKQDEEAMDYLQHEILYAKKGILTIPISLDPETEGASIRFVESHLFDLRKFLRKQLNATITKFV